MRASDEHPLVPTLKRQLVERQIERREFLRYATLLGMAAPIAYAFVAKVTRRDAGEAGGGRGRRPRAASCGSPCGARPSRARTRIAGSYRSNSARQVLDYLTVTGPMASPARASSRSGSRART